MCDTGQGWGPPRRPHPPLPHCADPPARSTTRPLSQVKEKKKQRIIFAKIFLLLFNERVIASHLPAQAKERGFLSNRLHWKRCRMYTFSQCLLCACVFFVACLLFPFSVCFLFGFYSLEKDIPQKKIYKKGGDVSYGDFEQS